MGKNMIKLFWEILRRDERYKKDYEKLIKNKTEKNEAMFYKKWGITHPLDPARNDYPVEFLSLIIDK